MWVLQMFCSFSRFFWLFRVSHFHIKTFKISFSISEKENSWDFDRNCVDCIDQFGEYCYLNSIKYADPWTWDVFPFIWILFNFCHKCLYFSLHSLCTSFVAKFIPKYFIFDAIIWGIAFLILFSECLFWSYCVRIKIDFCGCNDIFSPNKINIVS